MPSGPQSSPGASPPQELVHAHRQQHLRSVRRVLRSTDVLVFTLGLTEVWTHTPSGTVYPTAPGTLAGSWTPDFSLKNLKVAEVLHDLARIRRIFKRHNPEFKMLLTVSPIPLTATANDQHVLAANAHSKSVLRAAAGEFAGEHEDVDYFPSFDLATSVLAGARLFGDNLRTLPPDSVDTVLGHFMVHHDLRDGADEHRSTATPGAAAEPIVPAGKTSDNKRCEDLLLEAFQS